MTDLAAFQQAFAAALMSDDQPEPTFRRLAFTVYLNTSARGAVEALRAAFQTVDMLVGEEMFTRTALDYRDENPRFRPFCPIMASTFRPISIASHGPSNCPILPMSLGSTDCGSKAFWPRTWFSHLNQSPAARSL